MEMNTLYWFQYICRNIFNQWVSRHFCFVDVSLYYWETTVNHSVAATFLVTIIIMKNNEFPGTLWIFCHGSFKSIHHQSSIFSQIELLIPNVLCRWVIKTKWSQKKQLWQRHITHRWRVSGHRQYVQSSSAECASAVVDAHFPNRENKQIEGPYCCPNW